MSRYATHTATDNAGRQQAPRLRSGPGWTKSDEDMERDGKAMDAEFDAQRKRYQHA